MAGKFRRRRTTPARQLTRLTVYVGRGIAERLHRLAVDRRQSVTTVTEIIVEAALQDMPK